MDPTIPASSVKTSVTSAAGRRIPVGFASTTKFAVPIPYNEPERLETLRRLEVLDTPEELVFNEITELAAIICGTPIAVISLVDAERQWFKAKVGLAAKETPRDVAFCAHAIMQTELFVVPDATRDPRFAQNPLVTATPEIRFYAGAPLVTANQHVVGTLCVIDRVARELSGTQEEALRKLGRQVVALLEMRRQVRELKGQLAKATQDGETLAIPGGEPVKSLKSRKPK
jgi:GAF domain-containing protein